MELGKSLISHILAQLSAILCQDVQLHQWTHVSGGSINQAFCLHASVGRYMLKVNNRHKYPDMFVLEAAGLSLIKKTQAISTPAVIAAGNCEDVSFLLLEWIESFQADKEAMIALGRHLAQLHRHSPSRFGLDTNNYMGSLPQSNRYHDKWSDFFVQERLQPMVDMALKQGMLNGKDAAGFEALYQRLPQLFNEEPPALLHGDLWNGNYLIDLNGTPYLIDPAVAYGHREFDIAMTTLFGGFTSAFYLAY